MTAQILLIFEKLRFYDFFFFFQAKLDIKKINRTSISQTLYWGAVRVHSESANRESKSDCSNPFDFRDMAFFMIFHVSFKKIKIKKNWILKRNRA